MKVILLQELKGRGGEGDVIEVARGFAVNYLLPRKVAIEATSGNLKQLEQRRHNIEKREGQRLGDAQGIKNALDGKTVRIVVKVGEEGRLFGSVTSLMLEEAIREQLGVEVERRKIDVHGHIKEAGQHPFDVTVYREIKAQLTVDVVSESDAAKAASTAKAADTPQAESAEPAAETIAEAGIADADADVAGADANVTDADAGVDADAPEYQAEAPASSEDAVASDAEPVESPEGG